jgi:hypothetical protein
MKRILKNVIVEKLATFPSVYQTKYIYCARWPGQRLYFLPLYKKNSWLSGKVFKIEKCFKMSHFQINSFPGCLPYCRQGAAFE